MNKTRTYIIAAILAIALTQQATATDRCIRPIAAMAVTPFRGQTPFVANVRYTLAAADQLNGAVIYWGDGTQDSLPANQRIGFIQHLYTVPGAYTAVLSIWNDCGGFATFVPVEVY
jgi:hypothetical protein